MEITGYDPLSYGIAPNRQVPEEMIQYALEQRIVAQPLEVEELFPPSTHGVVS
jgi:4,5-dihydroxyphthalate decarboxylase